MKPVVSQDLIISFCLNRSTIAYQTILFTIEMNLPTEAPVNGIDSRGCAFTGTRLYKLFDRGFRKSPAAYRQTLDKALLPMRSRTIWRSARVAR